VAGKLFYVCKATSIDKIYNKFMTTYLGHGCFLAWVKD
jgi:hypothetical protein